MDGDNIVLTSEAVAMLFQQASTQAGPVQVIVHTTDSTTPASDDNSPQTICVEALEAERMPEESWTPEMQQTISDLETRVEDLGTEIRTLKDVIGPLVSAFLKNKQLAKDVGNAPSFDPQATASICKILPLVTKHVQDYEKIEKTVSGLEQKLVKTSKLLTDQKKSKIKFTNLLKEVSQSTGLEDILAKLRIIFNIADVSPGRLFQTKDEDLSECEEDCLPDFDDDAECKMELDEDTGYMDTMPQATGGVREDGTYASDQEDPEFDLKEDPMEHEDADYDSDYSMTKKKIQKELMKERSCQFCEQVFMKSSELLYHIRTRHPDQNPYECLLCQKSFQVKTQLREHMNDDHPGQKAFTCELCGSAFEKPSRLKRHMKTHIKPVKCSECDRSFAEKRHLVVHMRSHNGERPFVCEVCGHACSVKDGLRNHMQAVHNLSLDGKPVAKKQKKNTTCTVCNKTVRLYGLSEHMRTHTNERPYKCDICPMSFLQRQPLIYHKKRHNKEFNHPCPHCDKKYVYKGELNLHLKRHDAELQKELTCPICNRVLSDKYVLETHMKTHSEIKDIKCDQCDMTFYTKRACREHVKRIHLGVKFQCDDCGQLLASRTGLNNHKRIHTGEKPFVCSMCNSQFRKMDTLKQHITNQHTNATVRYRCSKCGDQFKHKNQLHKHITKCDSTVFVIENTAEDDEILMSENQVSKRSLLSNQVGTSDSTVYVIQNADESNGLYDEVSDTTTWVVQ